jgi:hypothetical protein
VTILLLGHSIAEKVELKVCFVDEEGLERTVYKTNFTYFFDERALMADMMFQSTLDGGNSLCGLFPPLSSSDAVREYDLYLVDVLSGAQVPKGWNMVGSKDGKPMSTVEGKACSW